MFQGGEITRGFVGETRDQHQLQILGEVGGGDKSPATLGTRFAQLLDNTNCIFWCCVKCTRAAQAPPGTDSITAGEPPAEDALIEQLLDAVVSGDFKSSDFSSTPLTLTKHNLCRFEQALHNVKVNTGAKIDSARPTTEAKQHSGTSKDFKILKEAIDTGRVDPRSALGQRFTTEHQKGTEAGDAYRKLDRKQAAEKRLEWAKKQFDNSTQGKSFRQTWRHVDTTKGTFKPFSKLVVGQGNDWPSLVGALKLARKCSMMGHPWTMVHPQTERTLFLELEFSWKEEFEQAWSEFTEHFTKIDGGNRDEPHKIVAGSAGTTGTGTNEPRSTGAGTSSTEPGIPGSGDPEPDNEPGNTEPGNGNGADGGNNGRPRPKGKAKPKAQPKGQPAPAKDNVIKQACALKSQMLSLISTSGQLIKQIEDEPEWAWAQNEQNKGALLAARDKFKASLTAFGRKFIIEDVNSVKKNFSSDAAFVVECQNSLASKGDADNLAALTRRLLKRHRAA